MNPSDTANTIASWALGVSIFAAGIALVAAAFSAWQAITAHLARTRPAPASLVLPPAEPGKPRTIKNEGGSVAHSIKLLVWGLPSKPRARREAVRRLGRGYTPRIMGEPVTGGRVAGSLAAGAVAAIEGFGTGAVMFDPPEGHGIGLSHLEILYSPALAYWTDARGKRRHAWIEIR